MKKNIIVEAGLPFTGLKKGYQIIHDEEYCQLLAERLNEWMQEPHNFWLGDFAAEHGLHRNSLAEIAKKSEVFAKAYNKAKQLQENKLVKMGLVGKWNPYFVGKVLNNVAGWRDKQDVEHSGSVNIGLTIQKLWEDIEAVEKENGSDSIEDKREVSE